MKYFFLSFILLGSISLNAQDIIGKWKTIDDNTGKARSIVEIYKKGDKVYGKVVELFREAGEDPNPLCEECSGARKNKPVIGMEIITDMEFNKGNNEYEDGEILDPENGKIYDCKLWIEDGNLKVRGYLYFLYRTQTWLPAE